jgi:type IV pilus assembly protein PilA
MKIAQAGFTLIELMIVIAIVGILAAIAIPQYLTYTQKAKFTEVVLAATAFKFGVESCVVRQGLTPGSAITGCAGGNNDVPANATTASHYVQSVLVSDAGVITATSSASLGVSTTYILTPTLAASTGAALVVWSTSGSGCLTYSLC